MTWRTFLTMFSTLWAIRGGQASDLPAVTDGMTRRAFLIALGVSAGALSTAPFDVDLPLALDEPIAELPMNQLLTVEWITKQALEVLEQNLRFMRTINRDYAYAVSTTRRSRR